MGKASVIIYITVAVLLLLLISQNNTTNKSHHHHGHLHRHRHRRLKLRSNFTFTPPAVILDRHHAHDHQHAAAFDPIVAEIERRRQDKQWERHYFETNHPELTQNQHGAAESQQPEWEDFIDAEDYLNDEEKFNVTNRLVLLFPNIDVDPSDGYLSEHELTQWISVQNQNENLHRTEREMEIHDKNKDGRLSFSEYEPPSWVKQSDNNSFGYDKGWYKEDHFNASDVDGDGLLNITEFNDFLHPAESTNPKLFRWLCQEEIRERDTDKDGKVNFKEFFHGIYDTVKNYDEGHNSSHHVDDSQEAPARELFAQLDKDGDGYLSDAELLPIIGKLHPSERYYARQQAEYITQQADSDKDGRLTLTDVIENPYLFYGSVFNEDDDEDDDYEYHDEFR